jgi:hypothetical protein
VLRYGSGGARYVRDHKGERTIKKTLATLTTIGLILITVAAVYAEQKNLAGNWTFRVNNEMSLRLVLTQKGKNITGTLQNPHGNPIHLKGQFSGRELKFTGSSEGGEWAYRLTGKGMLQPDGSFAGDLKSNVGDMTWTAIRAPAE